MAEISDSNLGSAASQRAVNQLRDMGVDAAAGQKADHQKVSCSGLRSARHKGISETSFFVVSTSILETKYQHLSRSVHYEHVCTYGI